MPRQPLTIEHCLLGYLRQQPMHGYELHQRLSAPAGLGAVWRLKQGQLYALLARLEDEGYVTATLQPQDARPPRKVYRLTRTGRDAFNDWVRAPVLHGRQIRLEFMAKLFFARNEGAQVAAQLIQRQRAACQDWLKGQQAQAGRAGRANPYDWLVIQFRLGQIEAMLAWLDECEATLVRGQATAAVRGRG
jgi:DNA-binding PadR family transcriptional regulator